MNNKMSNGEAFVRTLAVMFVIFLVVAFINDATEPRCIKNGCDNKQAEGSSYCHLHKLYSQSGSHKSQTSSYNNTGKSSSTTASSSGSKSSSTTASSSGSKSSATGKAPANAKKSIGNSSGRSKYSSGSYSSYDDGYEDVYENDDYDWDRYYSDDDYADGVDDALDELDW